MVLKGVNWVHNDKISSNGLERMSNGYTNDKYSVSNGSFEEEYTWVIAMQNQVIWS